MVHPQRAVALPEQGSEGLEGRPRVGDVAGVVAQQAWRGAVERRRPPRLVARQGVGEAPLWEEALPAVANAVLGRLPDLRAWTL